MVTLADPIPQTTPLTMADLLEQLGDIPPLRVRLRPPPGEATENDVPALHDRESCPFELVDGVLVEKAIGFRESVLGVTLASYLVAFVQERKLGVVSGANGAMRLFPGTVRMPAVAYVSWARSPDGHLPANPIPNLAPDLAVEVLRDSNTAGEMKRKRREYFGAGCRLVWIVDPGARSVSVFTASEEAIVLDENAELTGGDVLPRFALTIADLFAPLEQRRAN
jgi:Uma2 family endonuclease